MSDQIRIRYEIQDGYVSGKRPHYVKFDREDWENATDAEKDQMVWEHAMERISIGWEVADD